MIPEQNEDDDYAGALRPSKSQLKREMLERQELGAALVTLSETRLEALALPERLLDALAEWQRTRSHEGRRRQLQYIGKLMRLVDPEPIRQALEAQHRGSAEETLKLHQLEGERLALLADDESANAAVTQWIAAHPDADVQRLRSLIRAARKDQSATPEQRSGRAYRELFQFLKDHDHD